ncbi:MAG TPA: hypothetical protein VEH83_12795, partial [Gemmatimonadales bacterium]|nr:hypothetical protein [Gemmatimonadales bacterium]
MSAPTGRTSGPVHTPADAEAVATRPSGGRLTGRGLVIQTAFFGDVVLTTPLIRRAAERHGNPVDVVVLPGAVPVLRHHPSIRDRIPYDKHGRDAGIAGFVRTARLLRRRHYAAAYLAQSSVRSAALAFAAGIPR